MNKIVVAYSGGPDSSVLLKWLKNHYGAEVIATAGSPAKRALLETLGVAHVIDSRRADFAEQQCQKTLSGIVVQCRGRFVRNQQFRRADQGASRKR